MSKQLLLHLPEWLTPLIPIRDKVFHFTGNPLLCRQPEQPAAVRRAGEKIPAPPSSSSRWSQVRVTVRLSA